MSTPVLTAKGLSKAFGPKVLLSDVSLAIGERERVGIVGDNGMGKSTLAKMLAGMEPCDEGEVAIRRGARVGYLSQKPALDDDMSAHEVVLTGLDRWRAALDKHEKASIALGEGQDIERWLKVQAEAAAEVERLGGWDRDRDAISMLHHLGILDPSAIVGQLSGGERRRVDLARLLVSQPDLAILDEPTNHLDVETIEWLEKHFISNFRGGLLIITHDRYVLERVAERTLEIDHGRLFTYQGGWSAYLRAKAERLEHEARREKNRQSFLRTEIEWLRRSPSARRTKQKARIQRAEEAIDATPISQAKTARLAIESERLGRTVLELLDVSVDIEGRRLVDKFELRLTEGERIGIVGKSGCGKTSLLRVLLGQNPPTEGEVIVGKNTTFAYFDQARTGLVDDLSIQENVAGKATRIDFRGKTIDIRSYMARFLFHGDMLRQKVGALSGGERARVALAKLLLKPANVLVFDEPTNDLDVATLGALEDLLIEADATAIIVSHDRYFLDRVATSIVSFEGDGKVVRYVGDYDTFCRLKAQQRTDEQKEAKANKPKKTKASTSTSGLSSKEQRELTGMTAKIEAAEAKLAKLDEELADPALYTERPDDMPGLIRAQEDAAAEVMKLMERWEFLEERAGG